MVASGGVQSSLPTLRRDLVLSEQETASGLSLILKDPVTGRFFRFRETERFIVEQLDGQTPLEVVRQRTERRFDAALPAAMLEAFVKNLEKNGLLESPDGRPSQVRAPKRVRGSALYLRLALLDPDRLFARLAPRVRCLFTPRFVGLAAVAIVVGLSITIANGRAIADDVAGLYRVSAIPVFLLFILVIASVHEFAHGVTCKHFGGAVHEVGFMLMFFQPAFYCNVSDAWLFPEKSKRLWVGFAGPYFELFVWAIATMAWRLTDTDTVINEAALFIMTISGIRSVFDFNPFVKLDGYYLLSDWLGIPNLRRRSFRYVGDLFRRAFGVGGERTLSSGTAPRERHIYLVYGLIATVSSLSLLAYGLINAGGYLIEQHQPAALLGLTSYVGLRSRRRLRRLFGFGSNNAVDDDGDVATSAGSEPPEPPEPSESSEREARPHFPVGVRGSQSRSTRSKRQRRRLTWAAVAAGLLVVLFVGRRELRVGGPFTVLPEENADVRAEVEGIVADIRVDEGQLVHAGDVIVRLADKDVRASLAAAEAQIRETRANLRRQQVGATTEELAVARAGVSRADAAVQFARGKLARSRALFESKVLTSQELEAVQQETATAENDLAEAQGRLNVLLRGTRREDIDATLAQIDRLESQHQYLETQLRLLNIVSPATGVVATPSRELKAMHGQFVEKGALIAKVYEVQTVTVQIVIPEKEIGDVRVGERVVLRSRAYPNAVFEGAVTTIATSAEGLATAGGEAAVAKATNGGRTVTTFIVSTQIDNRSGLLKPGMTGLAKVLCGDRRLIDLITRRLARTFRVEFWSWW